MRHCFQWSFAASAIIAVFVTGCSNVSDAYIERYVTAYKAIEVASAQESATVDTSQPIGSDEESPTTKPADVAPSKAGEPVHWSKRRGPAYPDDFWRSFGRDAKEMPATVWDDTKATFTDPWTLVAMGGAVAAGVAIDVANLNGTVADHYTKHGSQLSKCGDMIGDVGGNPGLHFGVGGVMYFTSLATGDVKTYETSKALIAPTATSSVGPAGIPPAPSVWRLLCTRHTVLWSACRCSSSQVSSGTSGLMREITTSAMSFPARLSASP